MIYLAIAGWLVYAVIKPRPALAALLAASPARQRWLFVVVLLACLTAVMNFSLGSVAGLSSTFILNALQHHR